MKKSVLSSFALIVFLLISVGGVLAASNSTESEVIANAYSCLNNEIEKKECGNMAMSELIFSTMATGECEDELRGAAKMSGDEIECWPKGGCDLKTTAQAMIALNIEKKDSNKIMEWFDTKRIVPKDVEWFLQIDTEVASACTIMYSGNTYNTEILENKKFTRNAGSCLIPSSSGYWLKVQSSCLDKEFEISCEESFVSTLLFKDRASSTVQVSKEASSEPEGGTSIEKIKSFCFKNVDVCDYEGTVWGILALEKIDYDILSFIPYLITAQETNKQIFSQPLLYILTGYDEYKLDILDRQIDGKYWKSASGKYFDTALALFPFQGVELEEKTSTIEWLTEIQDENGCWNQGNIKDMGFLLSSLWPKYWSTSGDGQGGGGGTTTPDNDCELSGYYCDSAFDRIGESSLSGYACQGYSQKCYDTAPVIETCALKYPDADVCNFNEVCPSNKKVVGGETCCVGATCQIKEEVVDEAQNECILAQGYCATSCSGEDIEESFYEDSCSEVSYGDVCCIEQSENDKNYLWLWILFALIILIVIAIIYRDKIREEILKMKSKGNKKEPLRNNMNRPRNMSAMSNMRQRRIIPVNRPREMQKPQMQRPQMGQPVKPNTQKPKQKTPEELNDVLRKLKSMSK